MPRGETGAPPDELLGHAGTLAASARQPVTRVNSAALKHGRLACLGAR